MGFWYILFPVIITFGHFVTTGNVFEIVFVSDVEIRGFGHVIRPESVHRLLAVRYGQLTS